MASLSNWAARHVQALVSSLGHLARHGLATVLAVSVMGLALALPLGLELLVRNVRSATGDFSGAIGLSVYLKPQISEQGARQVMQRAAALGGVAQASLITATQALQQLSAQSGFAAALDALGDNPLPHTITIRPAPGASAPERLEALRHVFESWPEVDSVQLDREWLARFTALIDLLQRALWLTAVLLGAGVLIVVGNTIRLDIRARGPEIEITQLVGGSRAFVRRPFLYTGALYGLMAAGLGLGIVTAGEAFLAPGVQQLTAAYGQPFRLLGPDPGELGAILIAGFCLGWLGAAIAAGREISRHAPGT